MRCVVHREGAVVVSFLLKAVAISLSGVMAPGPMTVATITESARRRHAGVWLSLGHGMVELPLIVLIVVGGGVLFKIAAVRAGIGLVGGGFLLFFGAHLLMSLSEVVRAATGATGGPAGRHPFWTGVVLTGGNPYFLLWWATIGLSLVAQAADLGVMAFALFALIHWLCDVVWLEALSLAGHKGAGLLSESTQKKILVICAVVLIVFGGLFLYDAGEGLIALAIGG